MKHRPRPLEQDDLLRPRLLDVIDPRHELVKLATLIDWEVFDREWAGFFPSGKGWPVAEPWLVAGLLDLQPAGCRTGRWWPSGPGRNPVPSTGTARSAWRWISKTIRKWGWGPIFRLRRDGE